MKACLEEEVEKWENALEEVLELNDKNLADKKRSERMMKLNLGCGTDIRGDMINLDKMAGPGVDVIWDINKLPLPFAAGSAHYVLCSHVLEHLRDWEPVVIDIHRVLVAGGMLEIRAPYGFQPVAYHRHFFSSQSMDIFTADSGVTSLDPHVKYELISLSYKRLFPFRYHLEKYLRLRLPHDAPIGRRWEVRWILKKPEGEGQ